MSPVILCPFHRPRDLFSLLGNIVRQRADVPAVVIENGDAIGSYQGPGSVVRSDAQSVGAARNACLRAARDAGFDSFVFFDADDYYDPNYVSSRLALLEAGHEAIGKTQGWARLDDGLYRFEASASILPSGGTYAGILSAALPFDESLAQGEDHTWWKAMGAAGRRMFLDMDRSGYCYIRHDANTWVMPSKLVRLGRGPAEFYGQRLPVGDVEPLEVRDEPDSSEVFAALRGR